MIQALSGRLIVEVIKQDTRLESGLYLPENKKEYFRTQGRVVSCGADYLRSDGKVIKAPCKDGDVIHIRKNSDKPKKINGKLCLLLTFEDVLGVEQ